MKTISIQVPDELNLKQFDYEMIVAAKLYEDGMLSRSQAAALAGISKKMFTRLLGKYNISLFCSALSDLNSDVSNM